MLLTVISALLNFFTAFAIWQSELSVAVKLAATAIVIMKCFCCYCSAFALNFDKLRKISVIVCAALNISVLFFFIAKEVFAAAALVTATLLLLIISILITRFDFERKGNEKSELHSFC